MRILAWGLLALALLTISGLFVRSRFSRSPLPEYFAVQPFTLTNQLGQAFTLQDLSGRVWIADVIFTRCAGPCPKMTEEMSKLQAAFPADAPVRFVTLTTDPEHDTAPVLNEYSQKFGADPKRWHFLTGPKPEILRNLAIGSLKLTALEKDKAEQENDNDLFIHSTQFVLVDKRGKVRGIFESLEPGFQEKIREAIGGLLREGE